mmetsp:Transcript_7614/g.9506  ORF Transcript_7614/g.9506 Transcript_7614/m.9506 type:complete len:601 (-) Transcript_7614:389-2191(-)|eukprot:CAMPEP_0194366378 /NCGR_PEP_ID=MMETSP0174-20130528/14418_1 /TAXON_ID=216777 /ORGANISM="Proboscia alata, Strain PI-D3" /LENGTH=600 /DNA_ID=CAMNT_0039141533 /DNA_START=198 /DNA_END=2000 /DNA_ORIENTATION=-
MSALLSAAASSLAASNTSVAASRVCNVVGKQVISHPSLPISSLLHHKLPLRLYNHHRSINTRATSTSTRQTNNIARIYARRQIDIALASFATLKATSSVFCESPAADQEKPPEWQTNYLATKIAHYAKSSTGLGATKISRFYAATKRIVSLSILATPLLVLLPLGRVNKKIDECKWEYSRFAIEMAGPTFIKLAQWATTRNDLFSREFIENFRVLQDNTRGHSWEQTDELLKRALGENYGEVIDIQDSSSSSNAEISSKEKDVIGSGCIAQVYKGKLKEQIGNFPKGLDVAVKVQHPGISDKVFVDFYILNKIAGWMEALPYLNLDYLSVQDSVDQFRAVMVPQLDLQCEARNLTRFRRDFGDDDTIHFPQPVNELTTPEVLVETFIHGDPILNCLTSKYTAEERKELAVIGLRSTMKMIFLHDFVHGDLHPGNILVDRNVNVRGSPLRLNMLDCGLVVEMGENEHRNLVNILGAFIKKDGILAGALMIDTAKRCNSTSLDVDLFCAGIQKICADDEDNNFLESVGDYLADICYLACRHKVKLESSFINAALACEIMEGIASNLHPTLLCQEIALPMVLKAEVMHGINDMKKSSFVSKFF